jgi:hypothetical protein
VVTAGSEPGSSSKLDPDVDHQAKANGSEVEVQRSGKTSGFFVRGASRSNRKRTLNNLLYKLRHRARAVTVVVDGASYETQLSEKPVVGAKIDIGDGSPVIVTEAKDVQGGVLVAAERVDEEVSAHT